jgi:hypothetical protein
LVPDVCYHCWPEHTRANELRVQQQQEKVHVPVLTNINISTQHHTSVVAAANLLGCKQTSGFAHSDYFQLCYHLWPHAMPPTMVGDSNLCAETLQPSGVG